MYRDVFVCTIIKLCALVIQILPQSIDGPSDSSGDGDGPVDGPDDSSGDGPSDTSSDGPVHGPDDSSGNGDGPSDNSGDGPVDGPDDSSGDGDGPDDSSGPVDGLGESSLHVSSLLCCCYNINDQHQPC